MLAKTDGDKALCSFHGNCFTCFSRNDDPALCALLVSRGAVLDLRDASTGEMALHSAVYWGCERNAELLIREGADVNASGDNIGVFSSELGWK